jgi:hypothetical protein
MAIGLNAAAHDPPIEQTLASNANAINIRFWNHDLTEVQKSEARTEFAKWVKSNGMRELLETFSVFMLAVYPVVTYAHGRLGNGPLGSPISTKQFERLGIFDQLKELNKYMPMLNDDLTIVESLNKVRNCFAHRLGVVAAKDVNTQTNSLLISWTSPVVELRYSDGRVVAVESVIGTTLLEEAQVIHRIDLKQKAFQVDSEIALGSDELEEICLCMLSIGSRLLDNVKHLAEQAGILKVITQS